MRLKNLQVLLVAISLLAGCREPFEPEIENVQGGVLVVEGYLDSNGLESVLTISRTAPISGLESIIPELGALVSLVSDSGQLFKLTELKGGKYIFQQDIPENQSYRLEILLRNGEKYFSDPITPILTPEILDAGYVRS